MSATPQPARSGPRCVVCPRTAVVEIEAALLCTRHGLFAMVDPSLRRGNRTMAQWCQDLAAADATTPAPVKVGR